MLPDYHKPDVENKKSVEKYQVEKLETKLRYDVLSGLSTNISIKTNLHQMLKQIY